MQSKANRYHNLRYFFFFTNLCLTLSLLSVLYITDVTGRMALALQSHLPQYLAVACFVLLLHLGLNLIHFPLNVWQSHIIERQYGLKEESFKQWLTDYLKSIGLSLVLTVLVMTLFYAVLNLGHENGWVILSGGWILGTMTLMLVLPIWILPMFYPTTDLKDQDLKARLIRLCATLHVSVQRIEQMALSRKTRKANAAVMGLGQTKRIVLGDTLLENFEAPEVEAVVCHELGHYSERHVLIGLALHSVMAVVGFYMFYQLHEMIERTFAYPVHNFALYPVLLIAMTIISLVLMPFQNMFSRYLERRADRYALKATKDTAAFKTCMQKLAKQNLAKPDPHPLLEFWFYSHPSIKKRIQMAERFA